MTISFYFDPLITRDHRIVRSGGYPSGFLFSVKVPEITPIWSGTMTLDIDRKNYPAGRAKMSPNYATISPTDTWVTLCYFVRVRAITPATVSMEFTVDWWGTYGGLLNVSGSQTRGATGTFGVPARFSDTPAIRMAPAGSAMAGDVPASRKYTPVIVLQCYQDNDWPAADGIPFQVTFIPNWAFTVDDINGTGIDAVGFRRCMAPEYIGSEYEGSTTPRTIYRVISVIRRQIVPSAMIFNGSPAPMFNRSATTYWWGVYDENPQSPETMISAPHTSGLVYFAANNSVDPTAAAPSGYDRPLRFWRYAIEQRADNLTENSAARRMFVGNLHNRLPVVDAPLDPLTAATLFYVRVTLTTNNGLTFEIENGDKVTDITALFDAGVVYSNEQEMRYQAGDAKTLGAIAGGISAAGQAIGGAAMLASGNPLGLLGIASAGVGIAQTVQGTQFRGRETVSGGETTAVADVGQDLTSATVGRAGDGLLNVIDVAVENAAEREVDAVLHGLVLRDPAPLANVSLDVFLTAPAQDVQAYAVRDPIVCMTDIAILDPSADGYMIAAPDDGLIAEAEEDLARGILVVGSGVASLSGFLP